MLDMESFLRDLKIAMRSLARTKGLALTVVLTLALGIGANAAIFSVVRGVLLRPLVNRDEDRLIYIRQSAPGIGIQNVAFSVPEIQDFQSRIKTISQFGDFSEVGFSMIGLGEPRELKAGVVDGSYFEVMGLHPVLGRLLDAHDDGPNAAGAVVLTYRFWTTALHSDPSVIGKNVKLDSGDIGGARSATIVGVLEPSIPYPAETEIIANVVTSPHHLSATMVTGRVHRMTDLFGRLAPGVGIEQARAELQTVHGAMMAQYPEAYAPQRANYQIGAVKLREQVTSGAKTILWVLLAASGLIFIIAVSNAANLILARTVRREGELAMRAALGATTGSLRRVLLADSLLLCGAGAALGVVSAYPMVSILSRYASRFSVRALDLAVDSSMLWVGALLAIVAAVLLAFVPRLPSSETSNGVGVSSGARMTSGTGRRLRLFAVTQIAASFMLLAGAGMLLKTLLALREAHTGFDMRNVLALNVPVVSYGHTPEQTQEFYKEAMRQIAALPGVDRVAVGTAVPWRDKNVFGPGFQFTTDGHTRGTGGEDPTAMFRTVSPGFFAALGVPILAGRDFNDLDTKDSEKVVIVSQSVAKQMFPRGDAVNHQVMWTDPVMKFVGVSPEPRRIVGVTADIDDENIVPGAVLTVYHPFGQEIGGGRLFVHTSANPYALVNPITRIIRDLSVDQPVEHAATLEDVRAEVLTPDRLNALVFGGFAAVALAIAVVGVAGVLVFSVSGRTREFGIRMALGAQPRNLLSAVIAEGALMAGVGILAGAIFGYALARLAGTYVEGVRMPGLPPVLASAGVLLAAAVIASVWPAARAARVDVTQALRSE
jgi:putative ABC transport system permease protein